MSGNYERWKWPASSWKCARCGKPPGDATHIGKAGVEPFPYNLQQTYCSPACAEEGKAELQRDRRAEEQAKKLKAWRCANCGGEATEFVVGKRTTCSPKCAALRHADLQKERRWNRRNIAVKAHLQRRARP